MNLSKFERYPLTFGVMPIEHLPRLCETIGADVEIYAKRDDCNSGLALGGNKLRKLAYIVPDAIRLAARTEAMITDPVYEGKSMQGMIDLAKKGFFKKGAQILYAHLGGAPALNGYSHTYRNG